MRELSMDTKAGKVTIIGAGSIGSIVAYTLMIKELASEIVLINRKEMKAKAKAMDMCHCTPFTEKVKVSSGSFKESRNSDIVVVTVGTLPNENGTRMDVLKSNIQIYKNIIPQVIKYSPNAVIIVVTNPLDAMAYVAYKISGLPASRVIGSGTLLDSTRFRYILGEKFNINPSNIEALVIGEHGDSMVPLWSKIKFFGIPIAQYLKTNALILNDEIKGEITEKIKRAGWDIRLAGEHSCYGISRSVVKIIENIFGFSENPIPVSTLFKDNYGMDNVFLSLPVLLNKCGVTKTENIDLSSDERNNLLKSVHILSEYIKEADKLL